MSEIKFKAGVQLPADTSKINDSDIVMVNNNMDGKNESESGLGSVYKGTKIVGTTKADELLLTEPITVRGTNVGNILNNDVLAKGTSIEEILKMMLQKEVGISTTNPTVSGFSVTPADAVEVGTSVTAKLSVTYVDGKYDSANNSLWNPSNLPIDAGCVEGQTTWTYNGNSVTSPHTFTAILGDNKFTYNIPFAASTVTSVKNNLDKDVAVNIESGNLTDSKTIKGYYKYFHGGIANKNTAVENIDIRSLANNALFDSSSETISSVKCPAGGLYVLVCPEGKSLSNIANSMSIDYPTTEYANLFAKANGVVKNIADGGTGNYNVKVYIIQNDGSDEQEYKNIIFK